MCQVGLRPVCMYIGEAVVHAVLKRKGKSLQSATPTMPSRTARASLPAPHFMCNRVIIRLRALSCQACIERSTRSLLTGSCSVSKRTSNGGCAAKE